MMSYIIAAAAADPSKNHINSGLTHMKNSIHSHNLGWLMQSLNNFDAHSDPNSESVDRNFL